MFSVMVALVKYFARDYPLSQIVFLRSFLSVLLVVLWLQWSGEFPSALHTRRLSGHFLRSTYGVVSVFLNFAAFGLLPLADVTAINFLSAPLILILSALIGREPMRGVRWAAVIGGFFGTLLMLWNHFEPGGADARGLWGVSAALLSACLVSMAMIQTRSLALSEHTGAIVFYFLSLTGVAALAVLGLALVYPADWPVASVLQEQVWKWPPARDWGLLLLLGVSGGVGQILMTMGFRYADASVIACFDYTAMIWALAIGVLIFAEFPTMLVLLGAGVIIASGFVVVWTEGRVGERLREALGRR